MDRTRHLESLPTEGEIEIGSVRRGLLLADERRWRRTQVWSCCCCSNDTFLVRAMGKCSESSFYVSFLLSFSETHFLKAV